MDDNLANEALVELKMQMKKMGASDDQIELQIYKLQDIILAKAIVNLCDQQPPPRKLLSDDELAEYINRSFKKSEIRTTLANTTRDVLEKYLNAMGLL